MVRTAVRIFCGTAVLGIALALGGAAPALGAYPNAPNGEVTPSGGAVAARSAAPTSNVSGGAAASQNLPFTGGDVIEIAAAGLGVAAAGTAAVLVARSRRRRPETASTD